MSNILGRRFYIFNSDQHTGEKVLIFLTVSNILGRMFDIFTVINILRRVFDIFNSEQSEEEV